MTADPTTALRDFKRECLLDEHRSLSSFVEKEIVMTTVTKMVTILAWLLGVMVAARSDDSAALLPPVAIAVLAFWSVDALYAYYGVIYKMRRLRVREWLELLPRANETELAACRTPANPFDGLSRDEKLGALTSTVASPAVSGLYLALLLLLLLQLAL
ncbi:MAG TPA: hypothetical protein VEC57_04450 [Candidatus Limnocylindrales bacterium]|nr:hypothetical protein [Candidatus Limnocylindrales bacterium]